MYREAPVAVLPVQAAVLPLGLFGSSTGGSTMPVPLGTGGISEAFSLLAVPPAVLPLLEGSDTNRGTTAVWSVPDVLGQYNSHGSGTTATQPGTTAGQRKVFSAISLDNPFI